MSENLYYLPKWAASYTEFFYYVNQLLSKALRLFAEHNTTVSIGGGGVVVTVKRLKKGVTYNIKQIA